MMQCVRFFAFSLGFVFLLPLLLLGYGPGVDQIVVVLKKAGATGRDLRYWRRFAGLSVADVVRRLNSGDRKQGGLPNRRFATLPYKINGEPIDLESNPVLRGSGRDTFSAGFVRNTMPTE